MVYEQTKAYLDTLQLDGELVVLSGLALGLAKTYDKDGLTATAAELRRTLGDIRRLMNATTVEVDPLEEILKR